MKIVSTNPSRNYEVIGEVEASSQQEVVAAVARARQAHTSWANLTVAERCKKVASFKTACGARSEELAQTIAIETGMLINEARGGVSDGLACFDAYIELAEKHLAPVITKQTDTEIHTMYREPWGVIAAICPWNFPLSNVAWQCGQALIAGNAIVYKNSEENPLFAQLIATIIDESDLPTGVFEVVYGDGQVGEWLVHADVDKISFTGSFRTGHAIAKIAAERFLPFTAELGGSTPLIVFEDTKIDDEVVTKIYDRRFSHTGQYCTSVKRLIVHSSKYDEVVHALEALVIAKKTGDALDEAIDLGPLVAERQVVTLEGQVHDALEKGAIVVTGGKRPTDVKGAYYLPTLLTNITKDMRVWQEETFGPVLPIVAFDTEDEAIALANDTEYGLSAHIFTRDREQFNRVSRQLQAGMVAQNMLTYLDAGHNPFGGYKHSGMGRENGEAGFHDATQIKIVSTDR